MTNTTVPNRKLKAAEEEEYQYSEIIQQGVIRLAILEPSNDLEAGIKCSLVHKSLEDCDYDLTEHYVALSYVWGEPRDTRVVRVDGRALTITASLDLALRHIRDKQRTLFVWADGICINQKDAQDRNQQVPLMGGIYSMARRTIIYLGPSTNYTDLILQTCQPKSGQMNTELEVLLGSTSFGEFAEIHILSRAWFTRIWILQE